MRLPVLVLAVLAGTVLGGCVGFLAAVFIAGSARPCRYCDEPGAAYKVEPADVLPYERLGQ